MRTLAIFSALALFVAVQPAAAQMCGPGQQAQASTPGQSMGGMCGMGQAAATDPMTETRPPSQQSAQGGGCPCCRNMAMMRGGGGMMQQHQGMPGMEQPKQ